MRTESEGKKLVVISAVTDEGLAEEDHDGKQERSGERDVIYPTLTLQEVVAVNQNLCNDVRHGVEG